MVELIVERAEGSLLERALERLTSIDTKQLSEGKKKKIENIMRNSQFGAVYCEYFLAEDPIAYRDSLQHNQLFAREAEAAGIDLKVLREGIVDEGVEIEFDHKAARLPIQKLENYTTQVMEAISQFYSDVEEYNYGDFMLQYWQIDGIISNHEEIINQIILEMCGLDTQYDKIAEVDSKTRKIYFDDIERIKKSQELSDYIEYIKLDPEERNRVHESGLIDAIQDSLQKQVKEKLVKNAKAAVKNWAGGLYSLYEEFDEHGKLDFSKMKMSEAKNIYWILRDLCDEFIDDIPTGLDIFFYNHNLINENLAGHIEDLDMKPTNRKLKKATSARYFVQVEQKLPEDVTFGNDGGCCIAVGNEYLGNGDSVPFYQLDDGTIILGIYQQVGNRKPQRVGTSVVFATFDDDNDAATLINSYELSESMNPLNDEGLKKLVSHITDYLHRFNDETGFGNEAGFKRLGTGIHDYNTGRKYIDDDLIINPEGEVLTKLPKRNDCPTFFSEVFYDQDKEKGQSAFGQWSFVIRDD